MTRWTVPKSRNNSRRGSDFARQRLAGTCSRSNEYACRNRSFATRSDIRFVAMEKQNNTNGWQWWLLSRPRGSYKRQCIREFPVDPCGGGVEYLHRDPASRRRRRNGKSQIWDSKLWSRVPRGSDPRMTALARASSNCKRQTRPLVRESVPHQQTRNCPPVIKIWS
jgi:hypothetical protein